MDIPRPRPDDRSGLTTGSLSSAFHSQESSFDFDSLILFSKIEFTNSFPADLKILTVVSSHALSSRVILLTLLTWTPSFLCVPEHSMQRVTVRFRDAQSGMGAPQSAQHAFPGTDLSSSRTGLSSTASALNSLRNELAVMKSPSEFSGHRSVESASTSV